jgi:riboflavin kinase/FMN adenylyltransferase
MAVKIKYLDYTDTIKEDNLILCLGFFDGLHKAHLALVKKGQIIKKEKKLKLAVLTFDQSIRNFMQNKPFYFLTSVYDKAKILENYDVDILYVMKVSFSLIKFDKDMFIEQFLKPIKVCVAGEDFTFGYKSLGTVDDLKNCDYFESVIIKEITYHHVKIGSTLIREYLADGLVKEANFLLGRNYTITGEVINGKGIGKELGFPTANIDYTKYLLPKLGVYLTKVKVDNREYFGLTNVGKRPTFNDNVISVETYIYDFSKDIYGKLITIEFLEFMRDEVRYPNLKELIEQINQDLLSGQKIIEMRYNNEKNR